VAVLVATVILASANGANATNSNAGTEWRAWLKERRGLILAPACAFGLTLAYFLTHTVMIHYYLIPGMLQTCLLLAFLIFSMEMRWQKTDGGSRPRAITCGIFAVAAEMAVIAGVALAHPTVQESARDAFTQAGTPVPTLEVPAPLLEKNAWIWGGEYSSSIVYYTGHPAFKIGFSSPEIRKQIYEWVKVKGDAQYMEMETGNAGTADMSGIFAEAQALGWRFSPVGTLRNATCYKMEKP